MDKNKNHEIFIEQNLKESAQIKIDTISACTKQLAEAFRLIVGSIKNRGKILFCGNGGSAADAQHLAAEMIIRLSKDINRPGLPAIALTTDSSVLTAGGNDLGFSAVFARQIQAIGHPEDILFVISTSGNSENILKALKMARDSSIKSVAFLGGDGGKCKNMVTNPVVVPSKNTQRIQETHITLGHILIEMIERELYQKQT